MPVLLCSIGLVVPELTAVIRVAIWIDRKEDKGMTHLPTEDETPVPGELLLYTSPDGNIRAWIFAFMMRHCG